LSFHPAGKNAPRRTGGAKVTQKTKETMTQEVTEEYDPKKSGKWSDSDDRPANPGEGTLPEQPAEKTGSKK
jgi:hypothetical protein